MQGLERGMFILLYKFECVGQPYQYIFADLCGDSTLLALTRHPCDWTHEPPYKYILRRGYIQTYLTSTYCIIGFPPSSVYRSGAYMHTRMQISQAPRPNKWVYYIVRRIVKYFRIHGSQYQCIQVCPFILNRLCSVSST